MARKRDLDDILKALDAIPQQVRRAVDPAIDKGADELVKRMRHLAPDDPRTAGNDLKSKIKWKRTGVPMAARVEAIDENEKGEDNALFQEYGTADMPAQPYFWPSVNTLKKRVRSRVDRAISKACKEAWGK